MNDITYVYQTVRDGMRLTWLKTKFMPAVLVQLEYL